MSFQRGVVVARYIGTLESFGVKQTIWICFLAPNLAPAARLVEIFISFFFYGARDLYSLGFALFTCQMRIIPFLDDGCKD